MIFLRPISRRLASAGPALRHFLFKIPLILTHVMPPVVLASMLLSLGLVSRQNEIIALRASRVSLVETAVPLLALAMLIIHGADGFYNIDHIDAQRRTVFGLTIYQTVALFELRSIIQVQAAEWTGTGWRATNATRRTVASNDVAVEPVPDTQLLRTFQLLRSIGESWFA